MMEPTREQALLFSLLRGALGQPESPLPVEDIDWDAFMALVDAHRLGTLLAEGAQANRQPLPDSIIAWAQQTELMQSMALYGKLGTLTAVLEELRAAGLRPLVLKGPTLSALYPKEESRVFSDLDLLIPGKDNCLRACAMLEKRGAVADAHDLHQYHYAYTLCENGQSTEFELHWRLNGLYDNGDFDRDLAAIFDEALRTLPENTVTLLGVDLPALPVTLTALHLLLHMLKHFMGAGFGLRLFCDWVAFWQTSGRAVDHTLFMKWLERLRLTRFYRAVTAVCAAHLGLDPAGLPASRGKGSELAGDLLQDVLEGGEFGQNDDDRMVIPSRKAGLWAYFMEMHRQMKKRFPRASRLFPLWPALWVATCACFLYNNLTLRKVSATGIIAKSAKRNRLAQQMHIFG